MASDKPPHRLRPRTLVQGALGLVLLVGSVSGVVLLLEGNTETHTLAVVVADTPVGTDASDIAVEFVQVPQNLAVLKPLSSAELSAFSDMVSNRALRSGDVLAAEDFSTSENLDVTGIALELTIGEPTWLTPGQRAVLWVAPQASENSFSAPFVLSGNVLIDAVSSDQGFAADGALRQVNLMVAHRDVPGVLHALANKYFLYLVPDM